MAKFWQNLFKDKDKKAVQNMVIMFAAGVLLLVMSAYFYNGKDSGNGAATENVSTKEIVSPAKETDKAAGLEKKLEETLGLVLGAGKVKAMITFSYGEEAILAQNETIDVSVTSEKDGQNGTRETETQNRQATYVMVKQKDGSEIPLIIKEIEPKIEGVVIIAEGGGDIAVKDALTRAAYTVLGVEPHKVQVLQMK